MLDKIRQSNVVATEAGGITQVIRAWRVEHGGRPSPSSTRPATKLHQDAGPRRQVTDIAVIVVAADDGVMPQTEEAISHAKAAGVSLVVAINKVDLPNANLNARPAAALRPGRAARQHGRRHAVRRDQRRHRQGHRRTARSISRVVAELKELKANPEQAGRGHLPGSDLSEGEGVLATLLVRDGTLHRGDVILCGASLWPGPGHVRRPGPAASRKPGRACRSASPAWTRCPTPTIRSWCVPDLVEARDIADKRKTKQPRRPPGERASRSRWKRLTEAKIAELKVILKADFRGSVEAIRKELEKLQHEEVRVRILQAGIGGITESDVQLALTSPEDTIIVGFNVVPDDRAQALAEERGVQIREYNIIYNLTNDIRAALEGKLKPREEVVHLGRAVVRETFKISRVGTIAGCYVTQGVIERTAKVRVIREGVVIYPPADRTVGLDSLKRFKDDAREVREGFECGIKIAGYDDIKVGDVIEAYRVEQVQRTLE